MNEQLMSEVLAAHADELLKGEAREAEYLARFPQYRGELEPLLLLARKTKEALSSVRPSEAFRNRLHQELVIAAQEELDAPASTERPLWRRPWVIGAATLGSVISVASAVGVIAYLKRAKASKPAAAAG
jgi:hypothetical protein